MQRHVLGTSLLLSLFLSAGLAPAQTTTTTTTYESTTTTGLVGFAPAVQAAQLNVLNVSNIIPSLGSLLAACPAVLEFHDAQNNVLKTVTVANVAPGTATSLNLKLADLPAGAPALRLDLRGVVKSNPITGTVTTTPSGTFTALPISFSVCSLLTSLELYDLTTGVTQTFTTDTRLNNTLVLPVGVL